MNSENNLSRSTISNPWSFNPGRSMPANKKNVLFVCYGNICRSPSAQGIFEFLSKIRRSEVSFEIDSAGTHDFHVGKAPDARAIRAVKEAGLDISDLRGRQLEVEDFARFDHIIVMDQRNLDFVSKICPPRHAHKVEQIIDFLDDPDIRSVPDPFHGEQEDFRSMVDTLFLVCKSVLDRLIQDATAEVASYGRD